MHKFEYWAHRLVPHMAFDDFIEKAENLGSKKPIKVYQSVPLLFYFTQIFFFKNALRHLRDQLNIQAFPNDNDQASHTLVIKNPSKTLSSFPFFSSIYYQQLLLTMMKILHRKLLIWTFQMMMN